MDYLLNDYHRNVPDEELIADVQKTAQMLNKHSLTFKEYSTYGKFHAKTIANRFGSWTTALRLAGLSTKGHIHKYNISEEEVVRELNRVAELYKKRLITREEYDRVGKISSSALIVRYGNWNHILSIAGLEQNRRRLLSNKDLLEDIERMWISLGRQPTTNDVKKGVSKYSLNSFCRHFGSWRKALEVFVDYINSNDIESEMVQTEKIYEKSANQVMHQTPRDINLRLRFQVLQRDNFKCCACGASPAKDASVVLHVDHIVPWSRGGETTLDNLQTLCSKCNLGKSDAF